MTAAEKVNSSPVIAAAAKIGMFLTPILVTIGLFVIGNYLSTQAQAMGALSERIGITETITNSLDRRTSVVESRAETQSKDLDKLTDALTALTQAVQSMSLVVEATKTDVGYLRRAEEKRRGIE